MPYSGVKGWQSYRFITSIVVRFMLLMQLGFNILMVDDVLVLVGLFVALGFYPP